jgi:hypothetical protein
MAKQEKAGVTMRAVIQRINRKLAADDEVLKAVRGERLRLDVGDFYIVDTRRNFITGKDIDPEALARELGVLKPWEAVRD